MNKSRFVLHPVLLNPRSRGIFFIYLMVSFVLGGWLWWEFIRIVKSVGVSLEFGAPSNGKLLSFFLSSHFKVAVIFCAAILAGGLTAQHVIGPIKRIEQWLLDVEQNLKYSILTVRKADKFVRFAELLNKLFPPAKS